MMELTPEERQKIYEEEKVRHQARAHIEDRPLSCGGTCLAGVAVILVFVILLAIFGHSSGPGGYVSPSATAPQGDILGNAEYAKSISSALHEAILAMDSFGEYTTRLLDNPSIPPPAELNMPADVKEEYDEARAVFPASPKASAALLRLAIQRLCKHLNQPRRNINADIGQLVKEGLPARVQKALDTVRVVGNNAVHSGTIDLNDNPEIALAMFKLVNMIVDIMITQPNETQALFESLPETTLEAIEKRDATAT